MRKPSLAPPDDIACIYARISQMFGETEDNLDTQEVMGREFASTHDLMLPDDLIFREKDSGHDSADDRVLLLRLRQLARERRFGHLIIKNTDRLARDPISLVTLWEEFIRQGIKVHFIQAPTEATPAGKMLLILRGMGHELEWDLIRQRTTDKKNGIRKSGKIVGEGGPKFGFKWLRDEEGRITRDRLWIIDEVSAIIVREIFRLIDEEGMSMRQVAVDLNRRGIKTPGAYRGLVRKNSTGMLWSNAHVRQIVIDEAYKGVAYANTVVKVAKRRFRKRPKNEWTLLENANLPVLIDPDRWERVNRAIRCNDIVGHRTKAKATAATRNEKEFAFFRGIVKCACCGSTMRVAHARRWNPETKNHKGAGQDLIYRCDRTRWAKERAIEGEKCSGRPIYEERVRDAAWAAVVEIISTEGMIEAEAARLQKYRPGEDVLRESLVAAERELTEADRRTKNLVATLADEDDREIRKLLREKIDSIKADRSAAEARIGTLKTRLSAFDEIDRRVADLKARSQEIRDGLIDPDKLSWEERRKILDWLDARFTGNGTQLRISLDLGLEGIIESGTTFVVVKSPTTTTRAGSSPKTARSTPA
jgi:DNA invertase Pin-like site-specific DNA recombinase